ncbi:MAG: ribosomal-processing cysteine protease Prp [Acutalibacteraceae bacterium]
MTEIRFYSFKGRLTGFEISGHSGYDEEGSDIVCAAVSSCAYMTINTATDVIGVDAQTEASDGYMLFSVSFEEAEKIKDLMKGFEMHVKALADQYSDYLICKTENIQVNNTEVQENA